MMTDGAVLIAGAGGLLGAAIAEALATRGARLVLTDLRDEALRTVTEQVGQDRVVIARPVDFRDEEAVSALVDSAARMAGGLASCVNAVGIEGPIASAEEIDLTAALDVYETNVFAAFRLTKAILPHMRRQGIGRIINIASGAGLAGGEFMSVYHSSKHAMVGLTRSIARELASSGISVNAVCPGCIESPMMERVEAGLARLLDEQPKSFIPRIPARRYAKPEEVANVVAYLALDAPVYLTGTALLVDGALYA
jgi:meso-butanediol dehydrogenase / (S,S)-butanediol dehydrogenase / diacetyl reductase